MPRYAIEVMYDGTRFHGSQVQGDVPTVQLALNQCLSTLFRAPVETLGASRTDEGVHALTNYYHFDLPEDPTFDLVYKCNAILPQGLAVKAMYRAASPGFNARFDALRRGYRYRIYTHKNPFLWHRALLYPFPLDREILNQTAAIIGQHTHFESFAKRNSQNKTFICNIYKTEWQEVGDELHYVVMANRFLRGMVRGLVATQLRMSRNGDAGEMQTILDARDCTRAFFDVTGHGLYLEEIVYPEGALLKIG